MSETSFSQSEESLVPTADNQCRQAQGSALPLPMARGQSLTSQLFGRGRPADQRPDVFSEQYGGRGDLPSRMVVRWPWKLIHYHGYDEPQLFNLAEDPEEVHDRRNDPTCEAARNELHGVVCAGWSGQRILDAEEEGAKCWEVVSAWARQVQPPEPDHWDAPEGCNVFPET